MVQFSVPFGRVLVEASLVERPVAKLETVARSLLPTIFAFTEVLLKRIGNGESLPPRIPLYPLDLRESRFSEEVINHFRG